MLTVVQMMILQISGVKHHEPKIMKSQKLLLRKNIQYIKGALVGYS
jgi:hypothetical protein